MIDNLVVGHPSISAEILKLKIIDPQAAAKLFRLLEYLILDPLGNSRNDVNVCPVRELKRRDNPLIQFTIYRAKIFPWATPDKSTHYRAIFLIDDKLCTNIYLWLGERPFNKPGSPWKQDTQLRIMDYQYKVRNDYLNGHNPFWRSR